MDNDEHFNSDCKEFASGWKKNSEWTVWRAYETLIADGNGGQQRAWDSSPLIHSLKQTLGLFSPHEFTGRKVEFSHGGLADKSCSLNISCSTKVQMLKGTCNSDDVPAKVSL